MSARAAAALALVLLAARAPAADGAPFPAGTSVQTLEGLRCSVVMPEEFDAAKEHSLLVVLHGAGGTETGMAGTLAFLAAKDVVVVAPKSPGQVWTDPDVDVVRRLTAGLRKRIKVGEGRLHCVGFSNGGWMLAPLAFDEDLRFASATWVAAGFKGGKAPKHARKGMGVLAMAGANDGNRDAAEKTVDLLEGKVRSVMCRIQPGKGHEWPDGLMPFFGWWVEVQEGRFVPGDCLPFDWIEDPAAAPARMAERKTGGLEYVYAPAQAADPLAKALQNEILLDPLVQRFGRQCVAWKREGAAPEVIVHDAAGKVVKAFPSKSSAQALAATLRSVVPDRSLPK